MGLLGRIGGAGVAQADEVADLVGEGVLQVEVAAGRVAVARAHGGLGVGLRRREAGEVPAVGRERLAPQRLQYFNSTAMSFPQDGQYIREPQGGTV